MYIAVFAHAGEFCTFLCPQTDPFGCLLDCSLGSASSTTALYNLKSSPLYTLNPLPPNILRLNHFLPPLHLRPSCHLTVLSNSTSPHHSSWARSRNQLCRLLTWYIACLIWAQLGPILLGTGFRGLHHVIEPMHGSATARLEALQHRHMQEPFVDTRLQSLLGIPLERGPMFETHRDCLLRAARISDLHYMGVPYHSFPDILTQTSQWAQSGCDKLHFVPTNREESFFTGAIITFSEKAAQLYRWTRAVGTNSLCRLRNILMRSTGSSHMPGPNKTTKSKKVPGSQPKRNVVLPSYFEIDCFGPVCHLSGIPSSKEALVSDAQIVNAEKIVLEAQALLHVLAKTQDVISLLRGIIFWTVVSLIFIWIPMVLYVLSLTGGLLHDVVDWTGMQELRADVTPLVPFVHQFLWTTVLEITIMSFCSLSEQEGHMPTWLIEPCLILGGSLLAVFFIHAQSGPIPYNARYAIGAIKALYATWKPSQHPATMSDTNTEGRPADTSMENHAIKPVVTTDSNSTPADESVIAPSSSSSTGTTSSKSRVPVTTTLDQDIVQMRQALREAGTTPSPQTVVSKSSDAEWEVVSDDCNDQS
ncbi:unnamed protein product [Periconia digitata]|uniref:Uncharacterized protein n=1 Tax=Periconia digitata TaxID=1303443 RepID=A0A9W4UCP2_9PLEO|nr:unnamed protein product [Periconia digitata]